MVIKKWTDSINEAVREIAAYQNKTKTPFKSGIEHFDENSLGGLYPGDCVVIGGLASHGKSFLLTEIEEGILDNAEKEGKKVVLLRFNLEMSARKILMRELKKGTGLKMTDLLLKKPNDYTKFKEICDKQRHRTNVYHSEMPPDDKEFEKIVREFVTEHSKEVIENEKVIRKKADLILVTFDHIALAKADNDIKRVMDKIIASIIVTKMEYKDILSYIVLSQLNRELENRTGMEEFPKLSDFYMSSTMAFAADLMIAVVNPFIMGKARYGVIKVKDNPQLEYFFNEGKISAQGFGSLEPKGNVFYHYIKVRMPDSEEYRSVFGKRIIGNEKKYDETKLIDSSTPENDPDNPLNDTNWGLMRSNDTDLEF